MSAPVAAYVQAANEGANLGDLVSANRKLVGVNVVEALRFDPTYQPDLTGLYSVQRGVVAAITAAGQDGTSTGYAWFQNPVGSTKTARLRKLNVQISVSSAAAISHPTAPYIALDRATFTGTFAGAALTPAKRKTADATPTCNWRTAVTGATVSLVATIDAALVFGIEPLTADILNNAVAWEWDADDVSDDYVVIAPGECLVVYQLGAGTASDQRVVTFSATWDEYTT